MVRPRCSLFFSKRGKIPLPPSPFSHIQIRMRFLLYLLLKDLLTTTSFSKGIFQICFPLVKFWAFIHTPSLSTHVASSLFSSKSLTVWFRLPFSESSVRHTILSVQFVCLFSGPLEKSDLLTYCTCTFGLFFSWEWKWKSLVNSIDASRRTIYENFTWQVSA